MGSDEENVPNRVFEEVLLRMWDLESAGHIARLGVQLQHRSQLLASNLVIEMPHTVT